MNERSYTRKKSARKQENKASRLSVEEVEQLFADAMDERGFGSHYIHADDEWHRFAFPDSSSGKKSGSAKLKFGDDTEGVVWDFRAAKNPVFKWHPNGAASEFTDSERAEAAKQSAEKKAEQKARQENVRVESINLFSKLPKAKPDHPYLISHNIKNASPLKQDGAALVVPIYNATTGEFQAIQRIWPDGQKLFPKDAVVANGCTMPGGGVGLDRLKDSPTIGVVICEGWANAAAVYHAALYPTLAALSLGNIKVVAEAIHKRFPLRPIIIATDNKTREDGTPDPSLANADEVARDILDAKVAIPPPGDWAECEDKVIEQLIKHATAPPPIGDSPRGKTIIKVVQGKLDIAADETMKALAAAGAPVLMRAKMLVEPIWSIKKAAKGRETKVTALELLERRTLDYILTKRYVTFMHYDGRVKKDVVIDPPDKLLDMMLKLKHGPLPRVVGTVSSPTMRPDGSILAKEGYDAATQLWYQNSGAVVPPIADKPDKAAARAGLAKLKELLSEVAFSKQDNRAELNRSVAIAAILTAVLRGAFDLAPLFLFRAHMAGTGKSFLVDIISTIVSGRWCPVVTFDKSIEETQKRLGSLLLEAPPLISIDNLSGDLRGELIAQMVERPVVKVRILGRSEMPECEWRGVLFATGNNVTLVGDLTRRGLICNLDALSERPEQRRFNNNPLAMSADERGEYIAAALTIARAYLTSGESVRCEPLGSYDDWSRFVREPLIWLEEPDPVGSLEEARKDDPNRGSTLRLIRAWKEHLGTTRAYKAREILAIAAETKPTSQMGVGIPNYEPMRPEFNDLLLERAGVGRVGFERIDPVRFGYWLKSIRGEVHAIQDARYRIMAVTESDEGNTWKLEQLDQPPE